MNKDKVIIFDTTLRDGEQSAGASMSVEDKVEIAIRLNEMKVDVIEAGFPFASKGDFQAVKKIAEISKYSIICGLARAQFNDIDTAGEAIQKAMTDEQEEDKNSYEDAEDAEEESNGGLRGSSEVGF